MLDFMIATPKRHILARNRVFWHILRQNRLRGLGCSELQELQKKNQPSEHFWCAKSRMRGKETPGRIVSNVCTGVGVHDVITCANFYDCHLWGLSVVGGQILGLSIDFHRRPYNTLALPCECVMGGYCFWTHNPWVILSVVCPSVCLGPSVPQNQLLQFMH